MPIAGGPFTHLCRALKECERSFQEPEPRERSNHIGGRLLQTVWRLDQQASTKEQTRQNQGDNDQLPCFHSEVEEEEGQCAVPCGSPISVRAPANPKPCSSPKTKAMAQG